MSNKILLNLLIIIILFASCKPLSNNVKEFEITENYLKDVNKLCKNKDLDKYYECKKDLLTRDAVKYKDAKFCDYAELYEGCLKDTAKSVVDEIICRNLKYFNYSSISKSLCIIYVTSYKAINEKNISLCSSLRGSQNEDCIYFFAINENNATICDNLPLLSILKDRCYLEVAENLLDLGGCEKIIGETGPGFLEKCISNVSLSKNDLKACDILTSDYTKEYCRVQIAIFRKDPAICNQIQIQSLNDECRVMTSQIKNPVFCNGFDDSYGRELCFLEFAYKTSNVSICLFLNNTVYFDLCVSKVALNVNDTHICQELQNVGAQYECISKILGKPDLHLCNSTTMREVKDYCFLDLARRTYGGIQVCNYIENQELRDYCKSRH